MRRPKLLSALAKLAALTLVTSCDSFLEPDPSDLLTPENFYETSSDAVAAVNAIYDQVKWKYWIGFWYVSDIATDDIVAGPRFGSDGHRMSDYAFDATEGSPGGIWSDSYRIINRANAVLDRVPAITMDLALRTRLLGEAHFLRALAYFNLVRCFGDVPLLDHEVKSLTGLLVPRTPAAQVYALIASDLQQAAPMLPSSYSGADLGRATRGAAQALLAKVYLTQQDWTNAAQATGQVMTTGQYALLTNWKDNFKIATKITNAESIFEINYNGVLAWPGSVHTLFSLPSGYPGGDAYGLMYIPQSLRNVFAASDTRGNGATFIDTGHVNTHGDTITWTDPPGTAFNKYLDETSTQNMTSRAWGMQENNWIVLRYADILLMYAEAVNEGGPAGAITADSALNLVRLRAGLARVSGLSQPAFRDSVRLDRRREFVFEGHRWFDLSRWGILDAAIRAKQTELGKPVTGVPSNLMPIPQSEIDINPQLTQNPGW